MLLATLLLKHNGLTLKYRYGDARPVSNRFDRNGKNQYGGLVENVIHSSLKMLHEYDIDCVHLVDNTNRPVARAYWNDGNVTLETVSGLAPFQY